MSEWLDDREVQRFLDEMNYPDGPVAPRLKMEMNNSTRAEFRFCVLMGQVSLVPGSILMAFEFTGMGLFWAAMGLCWFGFAAVAKREGKS